MSSKRHVSFMRTCTLRRKTKSLQPSALMVMRHQVCADEIQRDVPTYGGLPGARPRAARRQHIIQTCAAVAGMVAG